jgi:hypothetical protein
LCEQQYFIEYVLGWRGPSGQKADKGTIVHKILEILAFIKQGQQDGLSLINDDIIGNIDINNYNLDEIIEQVYNYYSIKNDHHTWKEKDRKDCKAWVYKALEFNNGMFDPRNRNIVSPELHFDIEIKKPWAKYSYDTPDGKIEGNLAIKGTIDLITKINDNFFEIIDWKTGRRLDWATGKEKTQEKLENDPQLRIYHYALQTLYPNVDHIMVTINFINDGGAFSVCFDKNDLIKTESMLRNKFEKIKNTRKPNLHKSWMCSKLCHFGKTTFSGSHVSPLEEYRDGQPTMKNHTMTKCEQIKHDVDLKGIEVVTQEYKHPLHTIGFYKAPGEA